MTKILKQGFQIFLCRINSHQGLRISCISKEERIGANWHDSSWRKYWKRFIKIKSWKPLKTKLWAWIIDQNRSLYKHKPNPNAKNLEAAPKTSYALCNFCEKKWKLKTPFQSVSRQDTYSIALPRHQGTFLDQNHCF